jgi:hypothetical protein
MDGMTNEEVVVSIFYERLPSFCLCCGVIKHKDTSCTIPAEQWRKKYGRELNVPPTRYNDPRCWFLPDTAGQAQHQPSPALPWRTHYEPVMAHPGRQQQLAIIARVAEGVNKMTVKDHASTEGRKKGELMAPASPDASVASKQVEDTAAQDEEEVASPTARPIGWKRRARGKMVDQQPRTTQGINLGATWQRVEEKEPDYQPTAKRVVLEVLSLEECLGKEVLKELREAELTGKVDNHVLGAIAAISTERVDSEELVIIAASREEQSVIGRSGDGRGKQNTQKVTKEKSEKEKADNNNTKTGPNMDGMKPGTEEGAWGTK